MHVNRGVDRRDRIGKRRMETVTCRLHDESVATFDFRADQLVVARKHATHVVRVFLPETRRTLDVGEEEGDRA